MGSGERKILNLKEKKTVGRTQSYGFRDEGRVSIIGLNLAWEKEETRTGIKWAWTDEAMKSKEWGKFGD